MAGWTEDEVAMLKRDWLDKTADVIGNAIGRSRNAVIGMAHRLNLPAKGIVGNRTRGVHRTAGRRRDPNRPPRPVAPKVIHRKIESTKGPIPLLESGPFHCKTIIEGQTDENGLAMVCGKHVVSGQAFSFCAEHLKQFTHKGRYADVRVEPNGQQLQGYKR
jgi:hypothetical protein